MKLRRLQLQRALVCLAFVVLAAFFAAVIRNGLAQRNPQNALPSLSATYSTSEDTIRLPVDVVRMDKYDWRFMFWQKSGGGKDLEVWREIEAGAWVPPNSAINLKFTFQPQYTRIFIKAEESEFVELSGALIAPGPAVDTEYTLRVEANWGKGRDITYYVKIRVPAW